MNRCKLWAAVAVLFLLAAVVLPVQALAAETNLTLTVPERHSVTLEIGENGSVRVENTGYRDSATAWVRRQAAQRYMIEPEAGYMVLAAYYNGVDVTDQIKDNVFTAPALIADGVFTVTFAKDLSSPTSPNIPQTGDQSDLFLSFVLLLASGTGLVLTIGKIKRPGKPPVAIHG